MRKGDIITVNDKFQKGYKYKLVEPEGKNFDPEFKPQLTPKKMLELGVFGGKYMTDCKDEFPADWFKSAKLSSEHKDPSLNYYKVDASLSLKEWQKRGWINPQDPRGWFQWYCRYYMGRRTPDDRRQIKRWKKIKRHQAQVQKNCKPRDQSCRPRQRQMLLHWAYDPRMEKDHNDEDNDCPDSHNSTNNPKRNSNAGRDKKDKSKNEHQKEETSASFRNWNWNLAHGHKLLPFQETGSQFLYETRKALLADVVGLGKTIQALSAAVRLINEKQADKCIISVPSTLKEKWKRDLKEFFDEDALILSGDPDKRKQEFREWVDNTHKFMIISSDTLKRDWDTYMNKQMKGTYGIIIDEIQDYKNIATQRNKAMRETADDPNCVFRFGLSATYIETGLQDLFGSMLLIDDSIFGRNPKKFAKRYMHINPRTGKVVYYKNVKEAKKKMKPVSIRRRREEVSDQLQVKLPRIKENTVWLRMTKEQSSVYNDILNRVTKRIKDLDKAKKLNARSAMAETTYLQQASIATDLVGADVSSSVKLNAVKTMLPGILNGNKVVIFCHFTKFVDMLSDELNKMGIRNIAMHGEREEGSLKSRQHHIDQFQESNDTNVLITSDISKEGVDIPAANYIINTDILWNPASMVQRVGRLDRLNQKHNVINVVNLLCDSGIEQQMWKVLYNRQKLADIIMGDVPEKRISKFSFRDIKKLLTKAEGEQESTKMDTASLIAHMHKHRLNAEGEETKHGWYKNTRGVWEYSWPTNVYIEDRFARKGTICIADQNPVQGKSREAMMVRSNIWKPENVTWGWIGYPNRSRTWLGKMTPEGIEVITPAETMVGSNRIDILNREKPRTQRPRLILMSGIPASGKSRMALDLTRFIPNCVCVSRDEIRKYMKGGEDRTVLEENRLISKYLGEKYNVIVDDTNLDLARQSALKAIAKSIGAEFEVNKICVDPSLAVERDIRRPEIKRVGSKVIYSMYNKYILKRSDDDDDDVK